MKQQKSIEIQNSNKKKQQHVRKKSESPTPIVNGYKFIKLLGKGGFASVYQVEKKNLTFAIKLIEKAKAMKIIKYVQSEISLMKQLKSDNIVQLIEYFEDQNFIYIVLQYCEGGNLFNYILKQKPDEKKCIQIFVQILKGFREIHEQNIIHRDLKPDNILISGDTFKIADFGIIYSSISSLGVSKLADIGQTCAGTPYYMSPEIMMKKEHDYKTDIWSLGIILYVMLFRKYPFKNRQNMLQEVKKACIPKFQLQKQIEVQQYLQVSEDIDKLFERIFVVDPKNRISFTELWNLNIVREQVKPLEASHVLQVYVSIKQNIIQQQQIIIIHKQQIEVFF